MSIVHQLTAIIYDRKGRVLSIGQNSYLKSHPVQAHYAAKVGKPNSIFLHAEIHAITKCKDLARAHRILVTRYKSDGSPGLAKPCKICQSAIEAAGIKVVEYTVG